MLDFFVGSKLVLELEKSLTYSFYIANKYMQINKRETHSHISQQLNLGKLIILFFIIYFINGGGDYIEMT